MTYTPKTRDEIRQQILDDQEYLMRAAGVADPPVGLGTDAYIRADGVAGALLIAYANVDVAKAQSVYWTATGTRLQEHRDGLGVPELAATVASGRVKIKVTGSPVSLTTSNQFTLPNGMRGQVASAVVGAVSGQEVPVIMIDAGAAGNADGGTVVTWISPPLGMASTATVSNIVPLRGGADAGTDPEVQAAIRERVQGRPGAGNESQLRELAKGSGVSVQEAYVYPALGGPSSAKVVPVKAILPEDSDFSRAHDSDALARIRTAVLAETPIGDEVVVQAPAESPTDVALLMALQPAASAGGDGTGWANATPWPPYNPITAPTRHVTISVVASEVQIHCRVDTGTAPLEGVTQIAWWSPHDQAFHVYRVEAHSSYPSGGGTAWILTVDRSMSDSLGNPPTIGDFLSPASVGIQLYGDTWRSLMGELAPGENKAGDSRALRIPGTLEGASASVDDALLLGMRKAHGEILGASFGYRSQTTPTVPADVATAPNLLTLRHFGIYQS